MEQDRIPPPWLDELRAALGFARRFKRGDTDVPEADVIQALADARRAGWDGDMTEFWRTATLMAGLEGSLPQHPQRAYFVSETARFWEGASTPG